MSELDLRPIATALGVCVVAATIVAGADPSWWTLASAVGAALCIRSLRRDALRPRTRRADRMETNVSKIAGRPVSDVGGEWYGADYPDEDES